MLKDLKPFWELMRPYRTRVRFALIAGVIAGLGAGGGFTYGVRELFGMIFTSRHDLAIGQVFLIAGIFPLLFLVVGAGTFISGYNLNHAGLSTVRDLRRKLFAHMQALPIAYFQTKKTGDLISRLTADTQILQHSFSIASRDFVIQPITFLGAMGMLVYLALSVPGVGYIYLSIVILPVIIFPIRRISKKLGNKAHQQQADLAIVTNSISQNIGAIREVRAFNLQDRENRNFTQTLAELFRAQMKVVKYTYSLSPVVELVSSIGLSIAFVVGYLNDVPAEDFTAVFLGLYLSYAPIKRITVLSGELRKAKSSLERIEEILDTPIDISDPATPKEIDNLPSKIDFENVSFSYGDAPALRNVSTSISEGSICALVGPSGAGKSTFANLVPRFYDINEGSVKFGGIDVRQFAQKELRERIAIVSQDPVLFDDTVFENILLGRQNATREEVLDAAKNAFADEFIVELPNGYDTIVGERGTRLSGGQKQRIAIARAFLRSAPILILDEATSALDSTSEKKIQQALDELVIGKTVLIIAHRFSTIKNADKIVVFDDGRVLDSGSHRELHDRCPLYRRLYDQQATGTPIS